MMSSKFLNILKGEKKEVESIKNRTLIVKKNRCPQNHACPSIKVCPTGALSQKGYSAPEVDMNKCIECGKCVKFCPMRALSLA